MDIFQYYGGDLSLNSQGDLMTVDGVTKGQQRILRRLFTVPGTYIPHPSYGAGIQKFIGTPLTQNVYMQIQGLITAQMNYESCVAKSPAPVIAMQAIASGISVTINYTDAGTLTPQVLTFSVSNK